jgi:hypothetical protein
MSSSKVYVSRFAAFGSRRSSKNAKAIIRTLFRLAESVGSGGGSRKMIPTRWLEPEGSRNCLRIDVGAGLEMERNGEISFMSRGEMR